MFGLDVRRAKAAFPSVSHPASVPDDIDRIGHGEVVEASDGETE
jgi:hypothetical protein